MTAPAVLAPPADQGQGQGQGLRVIIAGSRHMHEALYYLVPAAVARSGFEVKEVVCGMAAGADTLGQRWAIENKVPVAPFFPNWKRYGRAAGPLRNTEMADYADALIVFIWQGSRGSENMLKQMQQRHKPCFVVRDGVLP